MMHDEAMNGFWGYGWLWIILILIIVLVVTFFLIRTNRPRPNHDLKPGKSALEILEERYARGEIDEEEYREKKENLSR
ncbi:MAG: SHOCT domain-containing protein [Cyclobacteriaceae bacterium]